MKLTVEHAGQKRTVDLSLETKRALVSNEGKANVFEHFPTSAHHVFIQGGSVTQVSVLRKHGDKVDVLVNGVFYTLSVVDEKRKSSSSTSLASAKEVKAVMPGRVVKINVKEGEEINAGDPLLVLEAMKMENEIKAAASGVIEKLFITEGATVETGSMLVRIA